MRPWNIPTFESLGVRDYRLLWMGQLSSSLGQFMDQLGRSWLTYSLTHSPLQLGLVAATRGVPLFIFGLFAGVTADRYSRKAQLIISQVANSLLEFILATLILTGHIQLWHIYVTGFLAGTVQAFQQPARQVLISDLVGDNRLLNAVALNSAASNLSRSVGPAICGLIIQFWGIGVNYLVQGIFFALATIWTAQIRVPESASRTAYFANRANQSMFGNLKDGFVYIFAHPLIWGLLVLGLAPTLLGTPYINLLPVFAVDVLHGGPATQGLLSTIAGVGAVIGAVVIASLGRLQGSGKLLFCGAAGFGISLMLFSRSPVLLMAVVFIFLAGLSNTAYTSQNQTMLQMLTPQELRGRVLGVRLLDRGLQPIGSALAGVLAAWLSAPWAVTIMGVSCFLLVVVVAFIIPDLWKLNLSKHTSTEEVT